MKDLYRCLDEYTPQMLEAIAAAWGIELPAGEPREKLSYLAEAMQRTEAVVGVLSRLAPAAREALTDLLREGGALPAHRLAVVYGGIRRLGPARIVREQPWLHPETALEELFYKGLVCRVYDTVDGFYGEVISVPAQLLAPLTESAAPARTPLERAEEPGYVVHDADALIEDLFRMLVCIRLEPLRMPQGEAALTEAHLQVPLELVGDGDADRLELLRQLTLRLGLVEVRRGVLRPSLRAREWLQLPEDRRFRSTLLGWRDNPQAAELYLLPHITCDRQDTEHSPAHARRALLEELAQAEPGVWLSLEGFIQGLKRQRPDYLRPDGDYDRWPIRNAEDGSFVSGFAFWDQVEGELARYLLTKPLRWLGVVALGYAADSDEPRALRITKEGAQVLRQEERAEAGSDSEAAPRATLSDDLTVVIPVRGTLYERYQLERFAVREAQAEEAMYRLTPESVWRGQNTGIKVEQIIRFLGKLHGEPVAPEMARTLQAWGGRFGRVTLQRSVVLRTVDERTMQQLVSQPRVRQLLGQQLAPTACLVAEEHLDDLLAQLKALGIWPELTG